MNSRHRHTYPSLLILGLLMTAFLGGTPSSPLALAQVSLPGPTSYKVLYKASVKVFAYLPGTGGTETALIQATPGMLDSLRESGLSPEVLDPDSQGKNYFLVYSPTGAILIDLEGQITPAQPQMPPGYALVQAPAGEPAPSTTSSLFVRRLMALPAVEREQAQPAGFDLLVSPLPAIQEIIDQIQPEAVRGAVGDLSGEWQVIVKETPYTFRTRYTRDYSASTKATRFVYEHFERLGLPAAYYYYTLPGSGERRSVVAEQTGLTDPGRIVILTAHLDSTSEIPYDRAPGADDNASGSSGVLLAAEVLSKYRFGCTIRYALFTGEEQGYYGSLAYAAQVYHNGEDIQAVLNLDMLGYNGDSNPAVELHSRVGNASDLEIADLFAAVVDTYGLNLNVQIRPDSLSFSDHASFWAYGYPALLAIEDLDDFTPAYHTSNDRLSTLDLGYLTEYIRAAVGTLAHMGCGVFTQQSYLPLAQMNFLGQIPSPTPTPTAATPAPTQAPSHTITPTPSRTPTLAETQTPTIALPLEFSTPAP